MLISQAVVLPLAAVEAVIGRAFAIRPDAEQRTEGVEGIEAAVKAERELIQVGLQVLMADRAMVRPGGHPVVNVGQVGAKLLARLVSVMPAQIGFDRLAGHVFAGDANPRQKLDDLVACVNPDLKKLRLEIFHVRASGYMLREMANSGENLLRA